MDDSLAVVIEQPLLEVNDGEREADKMHKDTPGVKYFKYCYASMSLSVRKWVVECEQISNCLSIKISKGCSICTNDYINDSYSLSQNIIEPLTLAYI